MTAVPLLMNMNVIANIYVKYKMSAMTDDMHLYTVYGCLLKDISRINKVQGFKFV